MNNKRRTALKEAARLLRSASSIIESALDEEQECMDNIPENLQDGQLYETLSENIDTMESAMETIEEIADAISDI